MAFFSSTLSKLLPTDFTSPRCRLHKNMHVNKTLQSFNPFCIDINCVCFCLRGGITTKPIPSLSLSTHTFYIIVQKLGTSMNHLAYVPMLNGATNPLFEQC